LIIIPLSLFNRWRIRCVAPTPAAILNYLTTESGAKFAATSLVGGKEVVQSISESTAALSGAKSNGRNPSRRKTMNTRRSRPTSFLLALATGT